MLIDDKTGRPKYMQETLETNDRDLRLYLQMKTTELSARITLSSWKRDAVLW